MKKSKTNLNRLIFLSIAIVVSILLASCSASDNPNEDCNCEKETYTYEIIVLTGANGLPYLSSEKVILSNESVPCQDEQTQADLGDNIYFDIKCN